MKTIPRGKPNQQPGTWSAWRYEERTVGVLISCPSCGQAATLYRHPANPPTPHTIQPDGSVQPSLVCPFEPCTFHEFIRLEGWDPKLLQGGA